MSHMQVCTNCPQIESKLTPTDIYTLLDRRFDPDKRLDVTEFLAAAKPILAKIPADGGNDDLPNAKEFYSHLATIVAEFTSLVAELAEPVQSGQKSVLDLRRMRKAKDQKIRRFEGRMNFPLHQNCADCVSDALREELRAYINFPTANPTSPADSSSGSTECRDLPEEPTSPTEFASRPTKRRFSQAESSETPMDDFRRVKPMLEARGDSLDQPTRYKEKQEHGERRRGAEQPGVQSEVQRLLAGVMVTMRWARSSDDGTYMG